MITERKDMDYFDDNNERRSPRRGGHRPGAGRKPESDTGEVMEIRSVRMTDAEWEKCKKLGGGEWIRERIKRAKLKEPESND